MIISTIGRRAIFLRFAIGCVVFLDPAVNVRAAGTPSVRGSGASTVGAKAEGHHGRTTAVSARSAAATVRSLQSNADCTQFTKNNECIVVGCAWDQGSCVPAAPPAPSTTSPTASPTAARHCSDDWTRPCLTAADCACFAASAPEPGGDELLYDGRRRGLQVTCSSITKRRDCPVGDGCNWIDNQCVALASQPTSSPSKAPTAGPPPPCECLGLSPTTGSPSHEPTSGPSRTPTDQATNPPTHSPSMSPNNDPVTVGPTSGPTTSVPTMSPTTFRPTTPPTNEPTYCGCPECTATIWNTNACAGTECYTCGARITFKTTFDGGSLSLSDACAFVSNEFLNGPCGPVCNPDVCNGTPQPTNAPTARPTGSPIAAPSTPSPTQQFFCGCSMCTTSVWNHLACNGSECYSCGSRITYLQTSTGGSRTEEQACTQVSNEFPNNECGPYCNPLLCNPEYLEEPNAANLIWSDEFDVDGPPDSTKWDYDLGGGGWGNQELQQYTNNANNVAVSNGVLRISAKRISGQYYSTRMVTRGRQAFKYGRIRFRASVAACQAVGTWPALWMLPENWVYGGWPNSGEIDVMETVGHESDRFFGTVHTAAYNHMIGTQKGGDLDRPKSQWHIFEIDWRAGNIRFAIDRQIYYQFTPGNVADSTQWPFDQDFHILMNIAVGGTWGAVQGVDATAFDGVGQYMEVDWVRVYSCEDAQCL